MNQCIVLSVRQYVNEVEYELFSATDYAVNLFA